MSQFKNTSLSIKPLPTLVLINISDRLEIISSHSIFLTKFTPPRSIEVTPSTRCAVLEQLASSDNNICLNCKRVAEIEALEWGEGGRGGRWPTSLNAILFTHFKIICLCVSAHDNSVGYALLYMV